MVRLTKWDPSNEMTRLSNEMNRLFSDVMGGGLGRESMRGSWVPAVDVRENDDSITIEADLPGFGPEQVDVNVENSVLTIRGERTLREPGEGEVTHRVERSYGAFERSFQMPRNVDPERIQARFAHGCLTLTLPKRPESKPRTIKIDVE